MRLAFGERFFNLAANGLGRSAFPFQEAQLIPQTNEPSLFISIHWRPLGEIRV
jgi:hypothetical protein